MMEKRKFKAALCCVMLAALLLAGAGFYMAEQQYCMDVPLISLEKLDGLTQTDTLDMGPLLFGGEQVAADLDSRTVYISQPQDKIYHYCALEGKLSTDDPDCQLYFLEDEALADTASSVRNGKPLTLVMVEGDQYQTVSVVITTLAVMSMSGELAYRDEANGKVYTGAVTLWCAEDPGTGGYTVQSSPVRYHVRGNSSRTLPKKSYKLTLTDGSGANKDLDLLGMGADDDWIINAMCRDDTKVREKLSIELWNRYIYAQHDGYPMSSAEYVEVVIGGEYQGLYLLQRRIDQKYLNLDRDRAILFKGAPVHAADSLQSGYEIFFSPYDENESYGILEKTLSFADGNSIDLESFMDVHLLIQFFSLGDSVNYTNMYYVFRPSENGYDMYFVPWDTDQSMGITWLDGYGYIHSYQDCMEYIPNRMEYYSMPAAYPELDSMVAKRWRQLRQDIYTEETLFSLLDSNIEQLRSSGALSRDEAEWGLWYDGTDTHGALYQWCEERIAVLDERYAP